MQGLYQLKIHELYIAIAGGEIDTEIVLIKCEPTLSPFPSSSIPFTDSVPSREGKI